MNQPTLESRIILDMKIREVLLNKKINDIKYYSIKFKNDFINLPKLFE